MADYTNKGIFFHQDSKKSDKHPDWKGSINVAGVEYDLAGWERQSKNGGTFLSLSVSPKREQGDRF